MSDNVSVQVLYGQNIVTSINYCTIIYPVLVLYMPTRNCRANHVFEGLLQPVKSLYWITTQGDMKFHRGLCNVPTGTVFSSDFDRSRMVEVVAWMRVAVI